MSPASRMSEAAMYTIETMNIETRSAMTVHPTQLPHQSATPTGLMFPTCGSGGAMDVHPARNRAARATAMKEVLPFMFSQDFHERAQVDIRAQYLSKLAR